MCKLIQPIAKISTKAQDWEKELLFNCSKLSTVASQALEPTMEKSLKISKIWNKGWKQMGGLITIIWRLLILFSSSFYLPFNPYLYTNFRSYLTSHFHKIWHKIWMFMLDNQCPQLMVWSGANHGFFHLISMVRLWVITRSSW